MMLTEREKKEMLVDAMSTERRQEFILAEKKKPKGSRSLPEYLKFLAFVQKFHPMTHERSITRAEKNLL